MEKNDPMKLGGVLTAKAVERIKADIASGKLVPGQLIPSERKLAEELGISRVTVRRGLSKLVQMNLLRPEPGRGYTLSENARVGNGNGSQGAIVFVHPDPEEALLQSARHSRIWAGAREEATRSGHITFISSISEENLTLEYAQQLAGTAAGVICDHHKKDYIQRFVDAGIPVVLIDYHRDASQPVDAIVQDDAGGITLAVNYLYDCGHRKIGFIDTTARYHRSGRGLNAEQRLAGFKSATAELGIDDSCVILPSNGSEREMVKEFLERGVTALIFPHVDSWAEYCHALEERGIELPSDFGVVTWGVSADMGVDTVRPTSITWSREQMGSEAVRRLLARIEGVDVEPASIMIPCRLEDRGTGGRGPEADKRESE